MNPTSPDRTDIKTITDFIGLDPNPSELALYHQLIDRGLDSCSVLDEFPTGDSSPVREPTAGERPEPGTNPRNAWAYQSTVTGSESGPLSGVEFAIKDNTCVAGLPTNLGSTLWDEFVPEMDATVVTRLLEAGATITGKAVCENHCTSGGSHTSDSGPVRNPYDESRSTGGSSSGCAALLVEGEVEAAIGSDTAGSIRIPSSWCGIYGLKPTFGLVPYTGAVDVAPSLDHLGPMARDLTTLARSLDAIAGPDSRDPRSGPRPPEHSYHDALEILESDCTVGIVAEGFGWEQSESDVDNRVREVLDQFADAAVEVRNLNIPEHRQALHLWRLIVAEGLAYTMLHAGGMARGHRGYYNVEMGRYYAEHVRPRAEQWPPNLKMLLILGEFMLRQGEQQWYGRAQNARQAITGAYDRGLEECDALVMPTTPMKARPLPEHDADLQTTIMEALGAEVNNTCPFNVTGHPALNVPCGFSEGLPVGMMLVSSHNDDQTLLNLARTFERTVNND